MFYSLTEIIKVEHPGQYEQELWQIKDENKLELIPKLKEEGNKFYTNKEYTKALEKYEIALTFIDQFQLRYLFIQILSLIFSYRIPITKQLWEDLKVS